MNQFSRYNRRTAGLNALGDDEIRRLAPSVFAERPAVALSDRYTYIPTSRVLEGLRGEGFLPVAANQTASRLPGGEVYARHMLRFRHRDHLNPDTSLATVGDALFPEIVVLNSHDGTSAYQLMAGIFRLVCSNGLIVGDRSFDMRVLHRGDVVSDVIDAAFEVISTVPAITAEAGRMRALQLTDEQRTAYAHGALALRYGADEDTGEILPAPITPAQLLTARRYEDREPSLWATYNTVQENLIRGGVRGRTQTGKRTSTRAIGSVNESVKINRGLWVLAQYLSERVGHA